MFCGGGGGEDNNNYSIVQNDTLCQSTDRAVALLISKSREVLLKENLENINCKTKGYN